MNYKEENIKETIDLKHKDKSILRQNSLFDIFLKDHFENFKIICSNIVFFYEQNLQQDCFKGIEDFMSILLDNYEEITDNNISLSPLVQIFEESNLQDMIINAFESFDQSYIDCFIHFFRILYYFPDFIEFFGNKDILPLMCDVVHSLHDKRAMEIIDILPTLISTHIQYDPECTAVMNMFSTISTIIYDYYDTADTLYSIVKTLISASPNMLKYYSHLLYYLQLDECLPPIKIFADICNQMLSTNPLSRIYIKEQDALSVIKDRVEENPELVSHFVRLMKNIIMVCETTEEKAEYLDYIDLSLVINLLYQEDSYIGFEFFSSLIPDCLFYISPANDFAYHLYKAFEIGNYKGKINSILFLISLSEANVSWYAQDLITIELLNIINEFGENGDSGIQFQILTLYYNFYINQTIRNSDSLKVIYQFAQNLEDSLDLNTNESAKLLISALNMS